MILSDDEVGEIEGEQWVNDDTIRDLIDTIRDRQRRFAELNALLYEANQQVLDWKNRFEMVRDERNRLLHEGIEQIPEDTGLQDPSWKRN